MLMRTTILGALAATLLSLTPATPATAQQAEGRFPTLTVTGQGSVSVTPDELRISFAIITEATTVGDALDENSHRARKVIDALRRKGVEEQDIQTTNFSIYPRYSNERKANQPPEIVGYRVQNQVRVKSGDMASAGDLIEAGVDAGANSVAGIQFTVSDEESVYEEAVGEAARDARRKATALAEAAGVRIVRIVSIDLEPTYGGGPRPMYAAADMRMATEGAPPIEPGEVQTEASVRIVFQISEG
ncbi:MAG: SIMPL domain-containing protein [Phycisphaerales bacterium]